MPWAQDCGCDSSEVVGMIIIKVPPGHLPGDGDFAFLHDVGAGITGYLLESGEGLSAVTIATGKSHGSVRSSSRPVVATEPIPEGPPLG